MKYIFTEDQFITLLALAGKQKLFLFHQSKEPDETAIIHAVTDLYQMGRLIRRKEQMVPSEDLMNLIDVMEKAQYIIKISFGERSFAQHLLYPAERGKMVVLEGRIDAAQLMVKLWFEEANYYVHDLFENDMFPEDLNGNRAELEMLEERAIKELPSEYKESDVQLQIQRVRSAKEKKDNIIEVFNTNIFKWLHVYGEYNNYYHLYSSEELINLLLSEIKGGEV